MFSYISYLVATDHTFCTQTQRERDTYKKHIDTRCVLGCSVSRIKQKKKSVCRSIFLLLLLYKTCTRTRLLCSTIQCYSIVQNVYYFCFGISYIMVLGQGFFVILVRLYCLYLYLTAILYRVCDVVLYNSYPVHSALLL